MKMTKERLEGYRSKKDEITELRYKIDNLGEGDSMIGNDTVFDYTTGFPRPQAVVGYDYKKYERLRLRYQNQIDALEKECGEIELWIEEIPDSLTRRIFRMRFIDGLSQQAVARKVHMHQSNVSRKISDYLQLA